MGGSWPKSDASVGDLGCDLGGGECGVGEECGADDVVGGEGFGGGGGPADLGGCEGVGLGEAADLDFADAAGAEGGAPEGCAGGGVAGAGGVGVDGEEVGHLAEQRGGGGGAYVGAEGVVDVVGVEVVEGHGAGAELGVADGAVGDAGAVLGEELPLGGGHVDAVGEDGAGAGGEEAVALVDVGVGGGVGVEAADGLELAGLLGEVGLGVEVELGGDGCAGGAEGGAAGDGESVCDDEALAEVLGEGGHGGAGCVEVELEGVGAELVHEDEADAPGGGEVLEGDACGCGVCGHEGDAAVGAFVAGLAEELGDDLTGVEVVGAAHLGGEDVAGEAGEERAAGLVAGGAVEEVAADGVLGDVDVTVEEGGYEQAGARVGRLVRGRAGGEGADEVDDAGGGGEDGCVAEVGEGVVGGSGAEEGGAEAEGVGRHVGGSVLEGLGLGVKGAGGGGGSWVGEG